MPLDRMSLLLAITSAAILSGCAALGEAEPVGGAAQAYAGNPRILPPNSSPSGHTYAEWAAKWWQWSLSFPPESNPMLDTTGQFCDLGQEGSVWFLAGVLNGDGTKVVRNCTIPAGEKLFFPLVNAVWVTTCVGEPRTIEGIHALNALGPAVDAVSGLLSAEIDGVPVEQLNRYRVESPLFCTPLDAFGVAPGDVAASCPPPGVAPSEPLCHDLPNPEELFGPEGGFGPAMTDGYWLMLAPLAAGEHTIRFIADDSQNVTYHITVVPGH